MPLTRNAKMTRQDDGMRGTVIQEPDGTLRVHYQDRGEWCRARPSEVWIADEPVPGKLREEEKLAVARAADQVLRSIVKNEPNRFWENCPAEAFDKTLVRVIVEYLGTRT